MKWPKEQVDIYRKAVMEVIANDDLNRMLKVAEGMPEMWLIYQLDRHILVDIQYTDEHPAYSESVCPETGEKFKARKRLCSYNPEFVLYPPGCNDTHRKTMLRRVAKELGLA